MNLESIVREAKKKVKERIKGNYSIAFFREDWINKETSKPHTVLYYVEGTSVNASNLRNECKTIYDKYCPNKETDLNILGRFDMIEFNDNENVLTVHVELSNNDINADDWKFEVL